MRYPFLVLLKTLRCACFLFVANFLTYSPYRSLLLFSFYTASVALFNSLSYFFVLCVCL